MNYKANVVSNELGQSNRYSDQATGWTICVSNPSTGKSSLFERCPDRQWGSPTFYSAGTGGSLYGGEAAGGVTLTNLHLVP
jgi:hypothetical protein